MKKIIIVWFLIFCKSLHSQDVDAADTPKMPVIVPATPDVMSFEKFGETPVSHYTGIPNISIPLYSLKTKSGFTVPLSLNYHAGGIKVDEKASRVGLGWSLNLIGSISKKIIGIPDNKQVFPNALTFNPTSHLNNNSDYLYALKVARRGVNYDDADSGYDIYSYNFLGGSGKFFIDRNDKVHLIPQKDIKVNINPTSLLGTIKDSQGNIYDFKRMNTSQLESSCPQTMPNPSWIYSSRNTSTLLSKITTPLKENVIFDYTTFTHKYIASIDETDYSVSNTFTNSGCGLKSSTACVMKVTSAESVLKSVTYDDTVITFKYSNDTNYPIEGSNTRKDFPGNPALRKVEISYKGKIIKSFELKYSYFISRGGTASTDAADYYRLKLTEVIEDNYKRYKFNYNESINLPPRLSYSQDGWGYYNGAGNSTLLPKMLYGNEVFPGAYRKPSALYTQANILTKINYPTGGFSEYQYENNTYFSLGGEKYISKKVISFPRAESNLLPNPSTNSHNFTIGDNFLDQNLVLINACDNGNMNPDEPAGVPSEGGSGLCYVKILNSSGNVVFGEYITNNYKLNLPKGQYTLNYRFMAESCLCAVDFHYSVKLKTAPKNVITAGVRVAKIINFDGSNIEEKVYKYTKKNSTESSGIVQGNPENFSILINKGYNNNLTTKTCKYLVRSSSNLFPVAVTGSSVGYSYVTEYKKDHNKFGRTEYKFTNFNTGFPTGFFNTLITLQPDLTWKKGLLLEKAVYDSQNNLQYQEVNEYDFDNSFASSSSDYYYDDKFAAGFSINLVKDQVIDGLVVYPAEYDWNYYFIKSSWVKKIKSVKSSYLGNNPVTTTANYFYDNLGHLQLTRVEERDSSGDLFITKTYYPDDVKLSSSLGGDLLTSSEFSSADKLKGERSDGQLGLHRIGVPLQVDRYKDINKNGKGDPTELMSRQRTNYRDWGNAIVLPESIETLKGVYNSTSNKLEPRIRYHSYYPNGNVKEFSKQDGTRVVYIWGYNEQYPVAKIEGVRFSDIPTEVYTDIVSKSNLDTDRTIKFSGKEGALRASLNRLREAADCPLLKEAMITTYTYDPLVGVTSITDFRGDTVYYHYDSFNRLEYVKDSEGKVLSKHKYHYKNQ